MIAENRTVAYKISFTLKRNLGAFASRKDQNPCHWHYDYC
jgi:hypothetical protein